MLWVGFSAVLSVLEFSLINSLNFKFQFLLFWLLSFWLPFLFYLLLFLLILLFILQVAIIPLILTFVLPISFYTFFLILTLLALLHFISPIYFLKFVLLWCHSIRFGFSFIFAERFCFRRFLDRFWFYGRDELGFWCLLDWRKLTWLLSSFHI